MVSALDVYQQKQVVARTRAQIPLLQAREALLRHELALLLGLPPRAALSVSRNEMPVLPELPRPGLPADLLEWAPARQKAVDLFHQLWHQLAPAAQRGFDQLCGPTREAA